MNTELFCRSKYKKSAKSGDDTFICIPDVVTGVFDGASDPFGTIIDGVPAGRLAASIVAQSCASLFLDPAARQMSAADVLGALSGALAEGLEKIKTAVRPSTTVALVLDNGDSLRLLVFGDTKIRVNGHFLLESNKSVDEVSTTARVMIFNLLSSRIKDLDKLEELTRRVIFVGIQTAIDEEVLSQSEAETIIKDTISETGFEGNSQAIHHFLLGGIKLQQEFANSRSHPLGFGSLNGCSPLVKDVIDETFKKSEITSLEIFTDGYFSIPDGTTLACWEQEHARIEEIDFHKVKDFSTVKGSSSTEFSDDRTVLIQRSASLSQKLK